MNYKKIYIGLISVILLSACAEEDNIQTNKLEPGKYPVMISAAIEGQLLNTGTRATSVEGGVGVSITDDLDNTIQHQNIRYNVSSGNSNILEAANSLNLVDWKRTDQTLNIKAYAPFSTTPSWPLVTVPLNKDQENHYDENDYLYMDTTITFANRNKTYHFKHLFSLIKITLKDSTETGITFTAPLDTATVKVKIRTASEAGVNMNSWGIQNYQSVDSIVPRYVRYDTEDLYEAIIFPQTVGGTNELVEIITKIGNQKYSYEVPASTTFEKNKAYIYNITVYQDTITVSPGTGSEFSDTGIKFWTPGEVRDTIL